MNKIRIDKKELYIEPISSCNLNCKLCYSNVINGDKAQLIPAETIISFIDKFYASRNKKISIYWCGTGEVFLHKDFPKIINDINKKYEENIGHVIITNGTIDRLQEFDKLQNVEFCVSIDGPEKCHEWNRGLGTYKKSIEFCKKATQLGCKKISIRTIITKMNIPYLVKWEKELKKIITPNLKLSLMFPYRTTDITKQNSEVMRNKINYDEELPSREEIKKIFVEKLPKKFLGMIEEIHTTYLSTCLNYNGVYNCCEGIIKIGDIESPIDKINKSLMESKKRCESCPLRAFC